MGLAAAIFVFIVAIIVFVKRRELAQLQAGLLGGSVVPGCVVAEVIVLIAIAIAIARFSHLLE